MTAHQLAHLLLAGPDDEVFMSPTVQAVDAVERCPGDPVYALAPYVVLRGAS